MSKRTRYSQREKFLYRAEKSKPGSTYVTKDGEIKEYTDFQRGKMAGQNQESARNLRIKNYKDKQVAAAAAEKAAQKAAQKAAKLAAK